MLTKILKMLKQHNVKKISSVVLDKNVLVLLT